MYRLMIVEDEEPVSHALCTLIPWETIGFEIVACAENAVQAQEVLCNRNCDVVLTDIVMSSKNGLELAKFINEKMPKIKVVILSGYSEFTYAQQAIKYGVIDYMVKPVDEMELINIFTKIKLMLDEESKHEDEEQLSKISDAMTNLRAAFLRLLISNQIENKFELLSNMRLLDIPFDCINNPLLVYTLKLLTVFDSETELKNSITSIKEVLDTFSEIKNNINFISPLTNQTTLFVIFYLNEYAKPSDERLHFIQETIEEKCKVSISLNELLYRPRLIDCIRDNSDTEEYEYAKEKELYNLLVQYCRLLVVALDTHDVTQIETVFEKLSDKVKTFSKNTLRFFCKDLLHSIIMYFCIKRNVKVENFPEEIVFTDLPNCLSIAQLMPAMKQVILKFNIFLEEKTNIETNPIISEIKKYIAFHISEDLRVEMLANKYNINSSYLSRLFRQTTGETLTDYLTRMRIEKAIEMMKCRKYKIQDIMLSTGFRSPSYFSTFFKKYTGVTPSAYFQLLFE